MLIIVYTTGKKSIIGIKEDNSELINFSLDSRLLYQNPSLFFNRFIKTLNKIHPSTATEVQDNISNIVFSLNGTIDYESGIVLRSNTLNDISYPLNWDGFNFKKCFQLLSEDKIHILGDSSALAYGIKSYLPALKLPALIISAEEELVLSLINQDSSIEDLYWACETIPELNRTSKDIVSNKVLDEIIFSGALDIHNEYTSNLIRVISHFLQIGKSLTINLKSIVFFSNKMDFIYLDKLINAFEGIDFIIPDQYQKNVLPLQGCIEFLSYLKSNNDKVNYIEYWMMNNKVREFTNYQEFRDHYECMKPIANPESEYRIYYANGNIKSIKMKYIDFVEQLKSYKF